MALGLSLEDGQEPVHDFPFPRTPAVELSAQMGRLREHEPVAQIRLPSGQQVWLVTRYDDVRTVLGDNRFSMAAATAEDSPELSPMVKMYPGLFSLDPPLHTQVRRLFTRALHAQPANTLRELISKPADELIDAMRRRRPPAGDLIADFCDPMVTQVASDLLGVGAQDIVAFRRHFAAMIALTGVSKDEAIQEAKAMRDLVLGVVEDKRKHQGNDVFSHIVAGFDADGTLPEPNLIGLGCSVLSSTANSPITQISYAIVTLLRHRDQWELLVREPKLVDSAVQECFRYSAPLEVEHLRIATADVEVGGVVLPKGAPVLTSVTAANRDPAVFPDPETFNITRHPNRHLGFGFGVHVCAGATVGEVMLRVALLSLTEHLPALRLAVPDDELFLRDKYSHALSIGTVPVAF